MAMTKPLSEQVTYDGVTVKEELDAINVKLAEWVSVKDFGAVGDAIADDTAAIQSAIDSASSAGKSLYVPAGAYRLVPSNAMVDEAGSNLAALLMRSGMHIYAEPGAKFKISDAVSSDLAPVRMSMFFSNQFLSNISIVNLEMDMNGQNNPISPDRGLLTYNKFTQAAIIFSGTPGGVAAGANDVHIERCKFLNTAGVSCIVMAQSNAVGVALGKRWAIKDCLFYNNGLDTDDHSSVFAWAQDVVVSGNTFENPAPFNAATHTGGLCAFEIHGSNTRFFGNRIKNYYQGLWISINLTEEAVRNTAIYGNTATVSNVFTDFYSANLSSGPSSESQIQHVAITSNVIEITADAVADDVKAFFKIAARKQPTMVRIDGNVCRSYETVKNCVLALMVVSPDQLSEANQIVLRGNTAAGIVSGLVCYFGGTGAALNIGAVEFSANDLGTLLPSPGGLLSAGDINLYGASAGKVSVLRVSDLSHPAAPISTDGHGGGRATVVGRALLNLPVTWNGITLGNGTVAKKIALDTDAGHADVSVGLTVGSTTVAAGSIYPIITGLVADSTGSGSALANYPASHAVLGARIDSTGNFISLFHSGGLLSESVPAALASGSLVTVAARFPCRSASI